jgi:hypothetical protein
VGVYAGSAVGLLSGRPEGTIVFCVGFAVVGYVGCGRVGSSVGLKVFSKDGSAEGSMVGASVGSMVGLDTGRFVDRAVGVYVGTEDGLIDEGWSVGSIVGCNVVGTNSPPPLARGEIGGTQTWISSGYWLRLDVSFTVPDVIGS